MQPIDSPDRHHINAAAGWLGLGDWSAANEELDKVVETLQLHPVVLSLRWEIHEKGKKHDKALEIATAFTQNDPDNSQSWISLSISLYRLGRTKEAFDLLNSKMPLFPQQWDLYYNLACYAAQLGRLDIAESMLHKAMILNDPKKVKQIALEDPDLEPLRKQMLE